MVFKDNLQPLLNIGLSKYEAKVYLTLIGEGVSTAKNISNITGIPYGKVYEIINSLSYKGFAILLPSKPMKYRAVSPKQAVTKAKNDVSKRFKNIEDTFIKELEPLFVKDKLSNQPKSIFSIIGGRSNVINKTDELIKKAKEEINIQCSSNSLSRLVIHRDMLKQAADKGIEISIAGITNKEILEEIHLSDFCKIRHINSSKNNFISVDGKECLVINPVPDDDNLIYGRDLGIYALSKSFTKFIDNFFYENFKNAREVKFEYQNGSKIQEKPY